MSRVNTYTSNRATVKLTSDGTLTTGSGGTPLKDRYYWACTQTNGSIGRVGLAPTTHTASVCLVQT